MSYELNGEQVDGNLIYSGSDKVIVNSYGARVNGKHHPLPKSVKGRNITTIGTGQGTKVYVDGYELTSKGWKRTLKALFHQFF